jgi:hypothetical protein
MALASVVGFTFGGFLRVVSEKDAQVYPVR